jgi:hypothetical protein
VQEAFGYTAVEAQHAGGDVLAKAGAGKAGQHAAVTQGGAPQGSLSDVLPLQSISSGVPQGRVAVKRRRT